MLLIVTNKQDPHADEVIRRLSDREVAVFRLNTEDILTKYSVSLSIDIDGEWAGVITDELDRSVHLHRLRAAWIRRPEFPFENPSDGTQAFIASELRALMSCIYALPDVQFVNEVFESQRSKTKFQQLLLATRMGIKVPRTLITNDAARASTFAEKAAGDIAVKSVHTSNFEREGVRQGTQTKRVDQCDFLNLAGLAANAPVQIQDYIDKAYELRVTVVGDKVFGVKIDSQINEETKVDWRPMTLLNPHSYIDLHKDIEDFCRQFVAQQGLVYGAMDFIVTPSGNHIFLENNPSGQYLWLEDETDAPITDSLVDWFASNC